MSRYLFECEVSVDLSECEIVDLSECEMSTDLSECEMCFDHPDSEIFDFSECEIVDLSESF